MPMWFLRAIFFAIPLVAVSACCPMGKCDYAFRPNWEARHALFVEEREAAVGKRFANTCVAERACPPERLDSGLVRYTLVDYRPWMKGCTFWYDVDPTTSLVVSVGYRGGVKECSHGPIR